MLTQVNRYLHDRRVLGFRLVTEGRTLRNFARFADRSGRYGVLTNELAIRWAASPKGHDRFYYARRLEVVRVFAKYLSIFEPGTQIPPRYVFGSARRRPEPYVYSAEEIDRLMRQANRLSGTLRRHTYRTLIGLLACTGLRVSEALRLKPEDVDLVQGVLTVRESKYRKTRLVPLHVTAIAPLRRYAQQRQRLCPLAEAFFVSKSGAPVVLGTADLTFSKLRKGIGNPLRPPRLYDLRHTYACQALLRWQANPNTAANQVTVLSRYLGHRHVTDTYWYLSGVPELMAQAGQSVADYHERI